MLRLVSFAGSAFSRACPVSAMVWCSMLLDLDVPLHVRMQRTKIGVVAGRREGEGEAVVGVERLRPELAGRDHRVWNVVAILPGHGGADFDAELRRLER